MNHLAEQQLERRIHPVDRDERVRHALLIAAQSTHHRRGIRRLIRAHLDGATDFVERHPANRRWLAKHPRIDARLWIDGIRLQRELPKLGPVELAVETDPLEVLRMGTYFGTCMGVGGMNANLTAAVALDVNKRVVYARDQSGTVVARQLLAMSDSERLVCYGVYPRGASRDVIAAFRDFDRAFARALAVSIHDPEQDGNFASDDGAIATIIAWHFWDDGAWDLKVDGDPDCRASKRSLRS